MQFSRWFKRIIKWLLGIVLGVVLFITGALYFFHDEIVQYILGEVNKNLKAKVVVSKVDITFWKTFPEVSIDFHNVFIQDALPKATKKDTLLFTDKLRLKFDPIDIWNKNYHVREIDVSPGTLQLKINKDGKVNYDIVKSDGPAAASKFELTLEAIHMEDMRFSYKNEFNEQLYSTDFHELDLNGKFTDKRFNLHTVADFQINRIQTGKLPFIVNQPAKTTVDIEVDNEKNRVSLPNGVVELAGLPFLVSVLVDDRTVHAKVSAKNLSLQNVANSLSVKEAGNVAQYKGSGTASFSLVVDSDLAPEAYPKIDCRFNISNGRLTEPSQQLVINQLNLDGNYSTVNGVGKEEFNLSHVAFSTIGGPFKGNLAIRQFSAPRYTGKAQGSVNLAVLHALFKLPKINTLTGNVDVDTRFVLATVNDTVNGGQAVEIEDGSGSAILRNVALQLTDDHRFFEQINGKVMLDQHQAALENISVILGKSDLILNGHFDHIDGFLQDKMPLEIEVIAQSRRIDLADFNSQTSGTSIPKAETVRDWLLPTMIHGTVRLDIGNIILEDHQFHDLHGNMTVGKRSIIIEELFGRNAEASVQGSLAVLETAPEYFEMATSLSSKNINFKPLFKEWHNFDQSVITADNISGKAEIALDFKAPFDMRNGVLKDKILAQIQLKVTNGNLKNVVAFKELAANLKTPQTRLILKKNEIAALENKLGNISFETLENTIYIKNSTLIIPSMEIHSSAIDITTEGTHTFSNYIDYKFAFRFRELKVQKDESEFGEVIDDGTGVRIYVRMYGPLDTPTIVWDKQAKKDQAKENRQQAKTEAISILKTEFGLWKKDSTIKLYEEKKQPHEELKIDFGKKEEESSPAKEAKKTNKLLENIKEKSKKLKQQQEKEKEPEFEVSP